MFLPVGVPRRWRARRRGNRNHVSGGRGGGEWCRNKGKHALNFGVGRFLFFLFPRREAVRFKALVVLTQRMYLCDDLISRSCILDLGFTLRSKTSAASGYWFGVPGNRWIVQALQLAGALLRLRVFYRSLLSWLTSSCPLGEPRQRHLVG